VYCILNGIERFFIEKIRVNEKIILGGLEMTQAEIISSLVFVTGVAGCFILRKKHQTTIAPKT
jgi:prolipoprotein diacylglyceryltransferase